jgi:hypothetical protein
LGLERSKAVELVRSHPHERISRQLEALPRRRIQTSLTGFLISAIEQDYPLPSVQDSQQVLFASHFYAEFAGSREEPAALPSALDEASAERLLVLIDASRPEEAGRAFARYVLSQGEQKSSGGTSLSAAIRRFGDRYAKGLRVKTAAAMKENLESLKDAHKTRSEAAYQGHLRLLASEIERAGGDSWHEFTKWMNARIERGGQLSERYVRRCREQMETMEGREELLIEFLEQARPGFLPSFWQWDASHNPSPFSEERGEAQ